MVKDHRFAIAAAAAGTVLALSWTPSVAIAFEAVAPATDALAAAIPGNTANLPKTIEFQKLTGDVEAGQTYSLVSSTAPGREKKRILHLTPRNPKLDRCGADRVDEKLAPIDCAIKGHSGKHEHEWVIEKLEGGGYAIKSKAENVYLNLTSTGGEAKASPQKLDIEPGQNGGYTISAVVGNAERFLTHGNQGWTSSETPYEVLLYKRTEVLPNVVPNRKETTGTTQDRPFAPNTGGSQHFRIPSLITHEDGSLLAAIDARWNHTGDASSLDTIFSRSEDDGKTWKFSFPNYFPDSTDARHIEATAFIDPVMVQKGDTTYMMVDLWPGGVALNTAKHQDPVNGSGYVQIEGKQHLVLFASPVPGDQRNVGAEEGRGYTHYVGDFEGQYAPVYKADDKSITNYVDRHYYLYDAAKQPLYCQQLGSSDYVQQNVFFYKADLHVMATSYLWLISSTDGGATWSDPLMLNEQVRTNLNEPNASFYGVGPGRGLVTSTGRIVLPCYTFTRGKGDGNTSVIYSDDGVNWKRSESLEHQTSESTVVEVDGVLYIFARHGWYAISRDGGATWEREQRLRDTGINLDTGCQISALTYSKLIDGKPAILLSCPTTDARRVNGKIFVGLVNEDGSIDWRYNHEVTAANAKFAYSCLTELSDGSIGLLWEGEGDVSNYSHFTIEQIAQGAEISNTRKLTVPLYGSIKLMVSGAFSGFDAADGNIAGFELERTPGTNTATLKIEGRSEGKVTFEDRASGITYEVTVAPARLVETSVEMGDVAHVPVSAGEITRQPDAAIAKVGIVERPFVEVWGEAAGVLGTTPEFTGDAIRLSDSMYEFTKSGDAWTLKGRLDDGSNVFVNLSGNRLNSPNKAAANPIKLLPNDDGTFKIYDDTQKTHLHFFRDGQARFDRCGKSCGVADNFELYRRVEAGQKGDSAIPGFERVTTADAVASGESYLIVAEAGGARYVLHPSAPHTSGQAHVAKVDGSRMQKQLEVTPVSVGTTDAVVDGTVHRITVTGYLAPTFTWSDGNASATATFKHTAGSEDKVLDCKVTSVRTEPTATEDGKVVYTATVEFEGKTYTDTRTVVLPATGEPEAPGGGETERPEVPGGPSKPIKPAKPAGNGSGLPGTGDPALAAGGLSAIGALLGALGLRFRKREE